jgi:hypothetical protein
VEGLFAFRPRAASAFETALPPSTPERSARLNLPAIP